MEAGWSQRRVADAMGVVQKTVSNLSNNGQVAELTHLAPTLLDDAVSILNGDAADATPPVLLVVLGLWCRRRSRTPTDSPLPRLRTR